MGKFRLVKVSTHGSSPSSIFQDASTRYHSVGLPVSPNLLCEVRTLGCAIADCTIDSEDLRCESVLGDGGGPIRLEETILTSEYQDKGAQSCLTMMR
jgi:hypothetical protein